MKKIVFDKFVHSIQIIIFSELLEFRYVIIMPVLSASLDATAIFHFVLDVRMFYRILVHRVSKSCFGNPKTAPGIPSLSIALLGGRNVS